MESGKNPLYFICLMPPSSIRMEVAEIKKEIKARYGIKHALKLPAHITVQIPFRMPEGKEATLIKKLEKFCRNRSPWQTELDGFGKFAKRVIFIKIMGHEPFMALHEDLQELMLSFLELKSHEISSNIHPHITIATRDLKRGHFPGIWDEFKERIYRTSFKVNDLHLLKHNGKTWDIIKKIEFGD